MSERLANLGYMGLIKETTKGVCLTPIDFIPLYEETLSTEGNFVDQKPIYGNKLTNYATLQGQRSHKGDFTVLAEPNTAAKLFDMLLTRSSSQVVYTFTVTSANATIGATFTNNSQTFTVINTIAGSTTLIASGTGAPASSGTLTKATGTGDATITFSAAVAGPSAHNFGLSSTANPNSYTVDLSYGNVVARYWGVEASAISPNWNANELQLKVSVSALGSFQGREIASINTTTIVLKTDYDPVPNRGLVVGDLVRIYKQSTGATLDTTIASSGVNADGITIVLSASAAAFAAGDMIYLRPATPSFTLLSSFLWSKTQFLPSTTATLALAASQLRVEQGSEFQLMHNFENDDGAERSGAFDPAALVRSLGDATLKIKKFFDGPDDVTLFNNLNKSAWVIRHFAGSSNQYEMRITFNNVKTDGTIVPDAKSGEINYSEINFHIDYDPTDAQGFSVLLIDALSTI